MPTDSASNGNPGFTGHQAAQPLYVGRFDRQPDGTIQGYLDDRDGWRLTFVATRDDQGYKLVHRIGGQPHYQGRMDAKGDGVAGYLEDPWEWRIEIQATKDGPGRYVLTGELGPIPDALRIPAIDGPPAQKPAQPEHQAKPEAGA